MALCTMRRGTVHEGVRSTSPAEVPTEDQMRLHALLHDTVSHEHYRSIQMLDGLHSMRKLTLSIKVLGDGCPYTIEYPCEDGVFAAVRHFAKLNLSSLQDLELETRCNDAFGGNIHRKVCRQHLCNAIHALLVNHSALRSVRLGLDYVCPRLFKSLIMEDYPRRPRLESLLLDCTKKHNLILGRDMVMECGGRGDTSEYGGYLGRTAHCQRRSDKLATRLSDAAARFERAFPALGKICVVWPNTYAYRAVFMATMGDIVTPPVRHMVYARDVLRGSIRAMEVGAPWDDESVEMADLDADRVRWRRIVESMLEEYRERCPENSPPADVPMYDTESDSESPFNSEEEWEFHGGRRDEEDSGGDMEDNDDE